MNKRFKKGLFIALGTVGALLLIGVIGIYIWTQQTYTAVEEIDQYTEQATEEGDWLVFEPGQSSQDKGFILYPGARVEPEAYSYLASMLTEKGYTVAIPSVRFNLAIADSNKADEMISASPINSWYIGGHSLGGVAAAMYASESTEQLSGLFFLASYPSIDLSESSLPVLSIYGENDGLTSEDDINESVNLLPEETDFFEIRGGNHAQFGMYGPQSGDNDASIEANEQQQRIAELLLEWANSQ
ncbi:hypothetical protein JOC54_002419 [Alkalihalobacillus xiaoxiensis]|uniref:Alpha/beta hydrolase fold-5 domain-containing protein n=1 Tax=Shouchella xiaoxiensis TaxID=766895 RepID=A0ABS2SUD6_9BACI|nr:alpha/beta hydrolase [Shouchella xiaoxiensis]MBM7839148.1 hypothetical protein [Shouchella xiaoxiensis]